MKYLENAQLEALASALSNGGSLDCTLDCRIESYSCKMVENDKRAWRDFLEAAGTSPHERAALSPAVRETAWTWGSPSTLLATPNTRARSVSGSDSGGDNGGASPVWTDSISNKLLFHLVSLLNASFGDYDFSDARGDDFHRVKSIETLKQQIESQLMPILQEQRLVAQLWALLDEEIVFKECSIYSYNPDYNSDPFSEDGCLWSFNYFFYNKRLRRILFCACRAINANSIAQCTDDSGIWAVEK